MPVFTRFAAAALQGVLLLLPAVAPAQTAPADTLPPTLEIAYGAGPLQLSGSATDGKVRWTPPASWGREKDTLLVYLPDAKRSHLFVRPGARDQVRDTQEPLAVTLPVRQQVEVQAGKGAVSVRKLQGRFRAEVESGPITIEELQGSLFVHTREGAVTIRSSRAEGQVSTGKGDVLIENTEGDVAGFSREGKVVTRFTKAYLQAKTTPLQVNLYQGALEVDALPKGGALRLRQGSVLVREAPKGVSAWTEEGDITLEKAAGTVIASTRKGNLTCTFQEEFTEADLASEAGNLTLTLPASFSGTIYLDHEQRNAGKGAYGVKSDFDLGELKAEPLKGPQGQTLALLTSVEKRIGTGKAVVRLRAVNGNITILKK